DQLTGYIATNWQAPILAQVGWAEDTPLAPSHPAEAPPVVVESRPGRRFTGVTRFADVRHASDVAGESESGTSRVEPLASIGAAGGVLAASWAGNGSGHAGHAMEPGGVRDVRGRGPRLLQPRQLR